MQKKYLDKLKKIELEILNEIDRVCKKNNIQYFLCGGTLLGAVRHGGFIPWDDDIDIAMARDDFERFCALDVSEFSSDFILNCFKTNKKCSYPYAKLIRKNSIFIEQKNVGTKVTNFDGIWVDIFPLDGASGVAEPFQISCKKKYERLFTLIHIKNNTNYYQNSKIKKALYRFILMFIPATTLQKKINRTITQEPVKDNVFLTSYCGIYSLTADTYQKSAVFPLKTIKFEGKEYPCMNDNDAYLKTVYGDYMTLPPKEKRISHNPYYIKFPDGEEIYPSK